jgi:outer membrane immunogenic protein
MYGGGGYGGHRYRVTAPVGASDITNWNNSFILLGGVELRASSRANVRVEFIHLDGTRNQVMVGIPIRF